MCVEETIFLLEDVTALLKLLSWFAVLSDWKCEYDHLHPSMNSLGDHNVLNERINK